MQNELKISAGILHDSHMAGSLPADRAYKKQCVLPYENKVEKK